MKTFVFAAVAVAFLQVVSASVWNPNDCSTFVPEHACDHCDFSRSYVQYVKNPCNCTEYFSCEKTRGYITAHKQNCARCLCFSDVTWGCTDPSPYFSDCPTEEPITEEIGHHNGRCCRFGNGPSGLYLQEFGPVVGPGYDENYLWYVNDYPVQMPCPHGTYFDYGECQCVHCNGHVPCAGFNPVQFCIDWEDWFSGNKRTWYDADSSCSITPPYASSTDHYLVLNGNGCDVEVPYFQKNEFSEFTFCGRFMFTGLHLPAGLAFDGGRPTDDCHPSIWLEINTSHHVTGGIFTGLPYSVTNSETIQPYVWYSVCLRYNGARLELLVTNLSTQSGSTASASATGNTELNRCNMLLGASVDQNSGEHNFFEGQFDDWCFSRSYLNPIPSSMLG